MPTTNQQFWGTGGTATDNDYTDPSGGDYRKWEDTSTGGTNTDLTTRANFGTTGGNKDIILDPYTTRSTAGLTDLDKFGWTVNLDTADGMQATATARRVTLAGDWSVEGQVLAAPVAALSAVTLHVRLYKRNADGTRTQIGSGSQNMGLLATTATNYSITISGVAEQVYEDDETFVMSFYVNASSQVGGLEVRFQAGQAAGPGQTPFRMSVPAPGIRTRYSQSVTGAARAVATLVRETGKILSAAARAVVTIVRKKATTLTATARGIAALTRQKATILSATARGVAAVTRQKATTLAATARAVPTLVRQVGKNVMATAVGTPTLNRTLTLARTLTATATGPVTLIRSKATTLSAAARGVVSVTRQIGKTLTATATGPATLTRQVGKIVSARAAAVASVDKQLTKVISATARGVVTLSRRLTIRRTLAASVRGIATGLAKLPFDKIPGGGTVIRKIFPVFDD